MSLKIGRKQSAKNILLNVFAFGIQFIIGFYISPIIVEKVGTSANGFIGLATDFVSYAAILSSVFNSVSARFIADAYYKKDFETANKYFNSLIVSNICISFILGIFSIALIPSLDKVIFIPEALIFDVKLTFSLIFLSYIFTLLTTVFTTSTFVSNRTDIQGVRNIIQNIMRLALIIVLLNFISVKIYWIALATLISTMTISLWNISLTKKLTPELVINLKKSSAKHTIDLAKAGSWMAISSVSTILLRGLDLTIANLMIGDYEMGLLSIARTMPNNVTSIIGTIAPIFTPVFLVSFSQNRINDLIADIKKSIYTMALLMFVPITCFIVYSYDFYALWQKSLTANEIKIVTILSIVTVVQAYFNSSTATMAQVSVVANKLKTPVIVTLVCAIVSFIAEIALIKFTDMGLYSIVISTTIVMIIRYFVFNPIYAAYCLDQPKSCFFWTTVKTWFSIPVLFVLMLIIRRIIPVTSWFFLALDIVICVVIGYVVMALLYFRNVLKEIVSKKILKKK